MNRTRLLSVLLCYLLIPSAHSKEPQKGYRQFFDIETSISSWNVAHDYIYSESAGWSYSNVHRKSFADVSISSVHGFQFNRHFFLGVGLSAGFSGINDNWFLGAFADVRTDQTFGKYTPYADLRFGILTHAVGLYFSPGIGYRFNVGHRTNLNVGLGMTLQYMGKDRADDTFYYDNAGTLLHITVGKDPAIKPYFTFRLGLDF